MYQRGKLRNLIRKSPDYQKKKKNEYHRYAVLALRQCLTKNISANNVTFKVQNFNLDTICMHYKLITQIDIVRYKYFYGNIGEDYGIYRCTCISCSLSRITRKCTVPLYNSLRHSFLVKLFIGFVKAREKCDTEKKTTFLSIAFDHFYRTATSSMWMIFEKSVCVIDTTNIAQS